MALTARSETFGSPAPAQVPAQRTRKPRIDPDRVNALKARDNVTNWRYLAFNWLVIAATAAGAIGAQYWLAAAGHSMWWMVPIGLVAVVVMGASQHQLGGAIHEGAHFQLFADRTLNEVASDWLAAYPIYTSTYHYRMHHLPHHQFVNDVARDPIFAQAEESGHWLDFPLTHIDLTKALLRLLWIPGLVRYIAARARYSALGKGNNPYVDPNRPGREITTLLGALYAVIMPAAMIAMVVQGASATATASVWAALTAATAVFYLVIPADWYSLGRVESVLPVRIAAVSRVASMALMYGAITAAGLATGVGGWAWGWFGLYWVLPLFTSFPIFMILREWLQHGNADRGRFTNTRVFVNNPLFNYAVMPWGMDYHLPHHLMANVPHYRLKELHELMLEDPEYREKGVVVEGLFGAADKDTGRPTTFGVLMADHAPRTREVAHVDDAVLERATVSDRAAIEAESAASRAAGNGTASPHSVGKI